MALEPEFKAVQWECCAIQCLVVDRVSLEKPIYHEHLIRCEHCGKSGWVIMQPTVITYL